MTDIQKKRSVWEIIAEAESKLSPEELRRRREREKERRALENSWRESRTYLRADQITSSPIFKSQHRAMGDSNEITWRYSGMPPFIVRPVNDGLFEIVVGERLLSAAQKANASKVTCFVREFTDAEAAEMINAVNDLHDYSLNALRRADAWKLLRNKMIDDRYGPAQAYTDSQVRALVGIQNYRLSRYKRLLQLPTDIRETIDGGRLGAEAAAAIASLPSPTRQKIIDLARPKDAKAHWPGVRKINALIEKEGFRGTRRHVREVSHEINETSQKLLKKIIRRFGDETPAALESLLS
jgi:ParB-like chromosome segregation protein Spo0J